MLKEGQYFWWNGTVCPYITNIGKIVRVDNKYIHAEILNINNTNTISISFDKKNKYTIKGMDFSKNLDYSHALLIEVHIFSKLLNQNIDGNKTNS